LKRARSNSVDRLRGPVLRSVSRSFYLSIRLLPARLRDPIALAYLLARATDTLADTAEVSATLRDESLRKLARAIQGEPSENEIASLRTSFAPLQKNAAERALIEALPFCLDWLEHLQASDREDVRIVMGHINRGQLLDVRRFGDATEIHALATERELDEYTYLVAGSVGEFWTQLCFRHVRNFSDQSVERMRNLGRDYGKGLQLINILRDAGSDLRNGRCYFPEEELKGCGVAPNELISRRIEVAPTLDKWRRRAEQGVAAGMDYCCAIRPVRVRFATALPALIGARTLALLREAGADALQRPIKVPRSEVRAIMSSTTLTLASPRALRKNFERLSR
jgi:farnesyl-diphosphate farnesyltransferase